MCRVVTATRRKHCLASISARGHKNVVSRASTSHVRGPVGPAEERRLHEPMEQKDDGTGKPLRCEGKAQEHGPVAVAQGGQVRSASRQVAGHGGIPGVRALHAAAPRHVWRDAGHPAPMPQVRPGRVSITATAPALTACRSPCRSRSSTFACRGRPSHKGAEGAGATPIPRHACGRWL